MTNPSNFQNSTVSSTCHLALETIGKGGSIAVLCGEQSLWERPVGGDRRSAADLAVQLEDALKFTRQKMIRLEMISVAVGPGSFTGLRIAVTTVKTLAYALDLPIIPVGSLSAIAITGLLSQDASRALVGLNAYRGQVFAAEFDRDEPGFAEPASSPTTVPAPENVGIAAHGSGNVDFDGRAELIDRTDWSAKVNQAADRGALVIAEPSISCERVSLTLDKNFLVARGVGIAAWRRRIAEGHRTDKPPFVSAFELTPRYLKLSAAEEKAAER